MPLEPQTLCKTLHVGKLSHGLSAEGDAAHASNLRTLLAQDLRREKVAKVSVAQTFADQNW